MSAMQFVYVAGFRGPAPQLWAEGVTGATYLGMSPVPVSEAQAGHGLAALARAFPPPAARPAEAARPAPGEIEQLAAALAARRDAARADYERKLARYQTELADANAARQPLWRKASAAHLEAERKWRRLAELAEAFGEGAGAVAPDAVAPGVPGAEA